MSKMKAKSTPFPQKVTLRAAIQSVQLPAVPHHPRAPAMPPPGQNTTMPCLPYLPRGPRYLKDVMPIPGFADMVLRYRDQIDLAENSAVHNRHDFRLPAPGAQGFPRHLCAPQMTIMRWNDAVFGLAQNAIQHMDPETGFGSGYEEKSHMHCGWSNHAWGPLHPSMELDRVTLVTIVMPPWAFTPKDFEDFLNLSSFNNPAPVQGSDRVTATPVEKLWGRIHDACFNNQCHFFVITIYDYWLFGAFTQGYTTGFVSEVMKSDATDPSVFETLCYWMRSSIGAPGAFQIPEAFRETEAQTKAIAYREHLKKRYRRRERLCKQGRERNGDVDPMRTGYRFFKDDLPKWMNLSSRRNQDKRIAAILSRQATPQPHDSADIHATADAASTTDALQPAPASLDKKESTMNSAPVANTFIVNPFSPITEKDFDFWDYAPAAGAVEQSLF